MVNKVSLKKLNPLQDLVDAYETKNGLLPKDDPTYDPQNPYVNRDPRLESILYNGSVLKGRTIETWKPGGADSSDGAEGWNASESGYYKRKFTNPSVKVPPSAYPNSSPQFPYIRYAEILLNYAEASYHLGDEGPARDYVNMVRSRPGVNMPLITESGPALLKRIYNERRIELYGESKRWFDVRRWKVAETTENFMAKRMDPLRNSQTGKITYKLTPFEDRKFYKKDYLVPIPFEEVKRSKLIQNLGYD